MKHSNQFRNKPQSKISVLFNSLLAFFLVCMSFLGGCSPDELLPENNLFNHDAELAFPGKMGTLTTVWFNGSEVTVEKIGDYYVFQGDMLIETSGVWMSGMHKGGAIGEETLYWPDGIVPYSISGELPETERVIQAIDHLESATDLEFVERSDESDYVEFVWDDSGCSSWVGKVGGRQEVRLADWATMGNVAHEIGHAIGLIHEHSKPNRDDHVVIQWEVIQSGSRHNFDVVSNGLETDGFDFGSIMLYGSYAFSKNGKPTITRLDGSVFTQQRVGLSATDREMIQSIYALPANFTDSRDGEEYREVKVGSQVWMAENLRFTGSLGCWSYDGDPDADNTYGKLYSWSAANVACPDGWHLPSDSEWAVLEAFLGTDSTRLHQTGYRGENSGTRLQDSGPGSLSVLLAGWRSEVFHAFTDRNEKTRIWTATSTGPNEAWMRELSRGESGVGRYKTLINNGLSVRCLKNNK